MYLKTFLYFQLSVFTSNATKMSGDTFTIHIPLSVNYYLNGTLYVNNKIDRLSTVNYQRDQ